MLTIRVYGVPKPQARPRIFKCGNFIRAYSPKTDWFGLVYAKALEVRPGAPLDCPVYLSAQFVFPRPRIAKLNHWKATRPDTDNLEKACNDALTNAGWWKDDSRVVLSVVQKVFETPGNPPGAIITAVPLENEEGPWPVRAPGAIPLLP